MECPRLSVCSGFRSLPVSDPPPPSPQLTRGQQPLFLACTAERQRPGQISLPAIPCVETPVGLRTGAPNPKPLDFCSGEHRLWAGEWEAVKPDLH